ARPRSEMSAARDANSGIPLQFARARGAAPPRRPVFAGPDGLGGVSSGSQRAGTGPHSAARQLGARRLFSSAYRRDAGSLSLRENCTRRVVTFCLGYGWSGAGRVEGLPNQTSESGLRSRNGCATSCIGTGLATAVTRAV